VRNNGRMVISKSISLRGRAQLVGIEGVSTPLDTVRQGPVYGGPEKLESSMHGYGQGVALENNVEEGTGEQGEG